MIANGVDKELDELRHISTSGKDYLLTIQQRESDATGIPSPKIGFNNVFGYYIEVRNTYKDKVPASWIRKQTLAQAERYITQELKEYEEKILGAEDRILKHSKRGYLPNWSRKPRATSHRCKRMRRPSVCSTACKALPQWRANAAT